MAIMWRGSCNTRPVEHCIQRCQFINSAKNHVYTYFMNLTMPIDMLLRKEPPYGFGHGTDVLFLFRYTNNVNAWKLMFCGLEPEPWQYEFTGELCLRELWNGMIIFRHYGWAMAFFRQVWPTTYWRMVNISNAGERRTKMACRLRIAQ